MKLEEPTRQVMDFSCSIVLDGRTVPGAIHIYSTHVLFSSGWGEGVDIQFIFDEVESLRKYDSDDSSTAEGLVVLVGSVPHRFSSFFDQRNFAYVVLTSFWWHNSKLSKAEHNEMLEGTDTSNNARRDWATSLLETLCKEPLCTFDGHPKVKLPPNEMVIASFPCADVDLLSLVQGALHVCSEEHLYFVSDATIVKVFSFADIVTVHCELRDCRESIAIKLRGGVQHIFTSFNGERDHCHYITRSLWLLRNPDACAKVCRRVYFDPLLDHFPSEKRRLETCSKGKNIHTPSVLWTRLGTGVESGEFGPLAHELLEQKLPYSVQEAVEKLMLTDSKDSFTTELKKMQGMRVVSQSKWGRAHHETSELLRGLTLSPMWMNTQAGDYGSSGNVVETHQIRRCDDGRSVVFDIRQEFHDKPYGEYFTVHLRWVFLPCEDAAEENTRGRGKGSSCQISFELKFKTTNQLQPCVNDAVLHEIRKENEGVGDLVLSWLKSDKQPASTSWFRRTFGS